MGDDGMSDRGSQVYQIGWMKVVVGSKVIWEEIGDEIH